MTVNAVGVFIHEMALHVHLLIHHPPPLPRGAGAGAMPHPPDSWLRAGGQDRALTVSELTCSQGCTEYHK